MVIGGAESVLHGDEFRMTFSLVYEQISATTVNLGTS